MMEEETNTLDELKQAAFRILRDNPGGEMDDWQQEFISEYGNELMDEYGPDPADVYSSLADLWEGPYYDSESGLEYNLCEWALAFATEESVRMYYDLIEQRKKS
jgi:hypothetical protein